MITFSSSNTLQYLNIYCNKAGIDDFIHKGILYVTIHANTLMAAKSIAAARSLEAFRFEGELHQTV